MCQSISQLNKTRKRPPSPLKKAHASCFTAKIFESWVLLKSIIPAKVPPDPQSLCFRLRNNQLMDWAYFGRTTPVFLDGDRYTAVETRLQADTRCIGQVRVRAGAASTIHLPRAQSEPTGVMTGRSGPLSGAT